MPLNLTHLLETTEDTSVFASTIEMGKLYMSGADFLELIHYVKGLACVNFIGVNLI